ncbi:helicase associated domain-containing protein [Streptomyces sp. NPDC048489]|uniref:helicase associated domain-containing protein n=1 Tax=Streptomyces sp. NPDC048489 TaxID=3154504 RepID=UPI0034407CC1
MTPAFAPARRTEDDRWAANLAAARQFHARQGHLQVPRKTVKDVAGEQIKLGASLDNTRRRASELTAKRVCGTRRAWDDDPIRDAGGVCVGRARACARAGRPRPASGVPVRCVPGQPSVS